MRSSRRRRWLVMWACLSLATAETGIGCKESRKTNDTAVAGNDDAAIAESEPSGRAAIEAYVAFLAKQRNTPVDYVLGLFDDHDIVIVCERFHPEWTQYEFLQELVSDPRFVDRVGHIFTEVGTSSLRPQVADLLSNDELSDEELEKGLLEVYRGFRHLWPYPNFLGFLRNIHALNRSLPPDQDLTLYPSDMPFQWSGMTKERRREFERSLQNRDQVMAQQIIDTFKEIHNSPQGRKKALVIMNYRHAFRPFPGAKKGDNVGRYLFEAFPGRVANVLLNTVYPTWGSTDENVRFVPIQEGKWDAAFGEVDNPRVGFDFDSSPFGEDHFDLWPFELHSARYQDIFTGFVFYEPLEAHRLVVGVPGILDDGFAAVLDDRRAIAGEEPLTPEQRTEAQTTRRLTYGTFETHAADQLWKSTQEQIARWRDLDGD